MKKFAKLLRLIFVAFILASCSSKEQKAAWQYRDSAEAAFQSGRYQQVVEDISKALGLYEKGDYDGSWAFLRGRAYAQLGQYQEAVRDFEAAIERGNQYLRSYALNSNPKFDAKRKFQQQLRGYHEEKNRVLQLMK